jgi:hypothetical protein
MLFNPCTSKNERAIVIIDPHLSILNNTEKYESGIVTTSTTQDDCQRDIKTSTPLRPKMFKYSFDNEPEFV